MLKFTGVPQRRAAPVPQEACDDSFSTRKVTESGRSLSASLSQRRCMTKRLNMTPPTSARRTTSASPTARRARSARLRGVCRGAFTSDWSPPRELTLPENANLGTEWEPVYAVTRLNNSRDRSKRLRSRSPGGASERSGGWATEREFMKTLVVPKKGHQGVRNVSIRKVRTASRNPETERIRMLDEEWNAMAHLRGEEEYQNRTLYQLPKPQTWDPMSNSTMRKTQSYRAKQMPARSPSTPHRHRPTFKAGGRIDDSKARHFSELSRSGMQTPATTARPRSGSTPASTRGAHTAARSGPPRPAASREPARKLTFPSAQQLQMQSQFGGPSPSPSTGNGMSKPVPAPVPAPAAPPAVTVSKPDDEPTPAPLQTKQRSRLAMLLGDEPSMAFPDGAGRRSPLADIASLSSSSSSIPEFRRTADFSEFSGKHE